MRLTGRVAFAFLASTCIAFAACGRVGGLSPNPDGSADARDGSGRAGTTGSGAAGKTGAAGKPAAGAAGASPTGAAGTLATGAAGAFPTGAAGTLATGAAGTLATGAAGIVGAAGTSAAGSTGAAGTGVSACKPGLMICTGPNQAITCLPGGYWSIDITLCAYGCFQNNCRQCPPGEVMCASTTSQQTCPMDGSRWGTPIACDNGCEFGHCAARCQPGAHECQTPDTVRTCQANGLWTGAMTCEHGCDNGVCRQCEPFGTECLSGTTGRRCQDDGKWSPTFTCNTACKDGLCTDCDQGTFTCVDEKNARACNQNGTWDPPQPCEFDGICFADLCRSCKPGTTHCVSDDTIELCLSDGSWGDQTTCANTCKAGVCTSNPKKVFVTSTTYKGGELGGLAGADAKCQARAAAGGLAGTFKAWLSDATGTPQDRFAKDGGPYLLVSGGTVANNWTGLTSGSLRHAINVTELGTAAPSASAGANCQFPVVWSDTNPDGSLFDPGLTCGDWTDSTVFSSAWGTTASQTDWSSACTGSGVSAATGCGSLAPLFCFQQ